jgi:hypothetical protein
MQRAARRSDQAYCNVICFKRTGLLHVMMMNRDVHGTRATQSPRPFLCKEELLSVAANCFLVVRTGKRADETAGTESLAIF